MLRARLYEGAFLPGDSKHWKEKYSTILAWIKKQSKAGRLEELDINIAGKENSLIEYRRMLDGAIAQARTKVAEEEQRQANGLVEDQRFYERVCAIIVEAGDAQQAARALIEQGICSRHKVRIPPIDSLSYWQGQLEMLLNQPEERTYPFKRLNEELEALRQRRKALEASA